MTSIKNTQTVHLFDVDTDWTRLASGYADYVNNGNVDIYLQRQKKGNPEPTDKGVRIRPGGSFVTHPGEDEITYLKTLAGTSQVAKYQDLNQGAGTTSLTDPESGNSVKINSSGQMLVVLDGRVDDDNSSNTPLLANAVFIGEAVSTLDYAAIIISSYSDVASAVDGLCIQFSSDGVNDWHDGECYGCGAGKWKTFSSQPERVFYRIKYTNGSTNQTAFDLQTTLKKTMTKPSSHRIQDDISGDDDAELVKSVLTGKRPNGDFVNFNATRNGNFKVAVEEYGDTPSVDAFSRLRVSNPYTIFDSKQLHDKQPLFWDEVLGGNATSTHLPADARTRIAVTANAADYAIRQTKMRFNYQPGKSSAVFFTFFNEHVDGLIKRCGLFDGTGTNNLTPNNGIFFETNAGISWNIAKNGTVTERVLQPDWNVDTLDGSGDADNPSGLCLCSTATQIGFIDFEWLGVGRVRVGFVIGGLIVYTHYFNHANVDGYSSVYMSTPNLPLRYDIQSDGVASGFIDHICTSVMAEGGREDNGIIRYASTAGTHVDANVENTIYAIMGIRLKADYNDISVKILSAALQIQTATHKVEWLLKFNPTVADTFTYADQADSAVQIARGALANTVTGGYDITGGFLESGGQQAGAAGSTDRGIENALLLGSKIDGTMDTIVLCARPIAGSTNVDIEGVLSWRELT
jgi:hypothetical protein